MAASASRASRSVRSRQATVIETIEARLLFSGEPITFTPVHSDVGAAAVFVTGDFNRDERVDIIARASNSGRLQFFMGLGDGRFSPAPTLAGIDAGPNVVSLAAGDFNRDGAPDLAAVNAGATSTSVDARGDVSVLYGVGNGSFRPAVVHRAGPQPTAVAAGDVNGDGTPDLVVANNGVWPATSPTSPQTYGGGLLLSKPDGFAPVRQIPLPVPTTAVAVTSPANATPSPLAVLPRAAIAFAGPLQTAASALPQTLVMILPGVNSLASSALPSFSQTILPGVNRGITLASLNGDRAPDVAALQVLGNNAGNTPAAPTVSVYTVVSRPSTTAASPAQYGALGPFATGLSQGVGIVAADFDRDRNIDIAVAGPRPVGALLPALQGGVTVLGGQGDGTLARLGFFATGRLPAALATADVNRDGRPDLVTTTGGGITAMLNTALPTPSSNTAGELLKRAGTRMA